MGGSIRNDRAGVHCGFSSWNRHYYVKELRKLRENIMEGCAKVVGQLIGLFTVAFVVTGAVLLALKLFGII